MTYNVFGGTLNLALSIYLPDNHQQQGTSQVDIKSMLLPSSLSTSLCSLLTLRSNSLERLSAYRRRPQSAEKTSKNYIN